MPGKISNWGNYPVVEATLSSFSREEDVVPFIGKMGIPITLRGSGLSYGDASLGSTMLSTLQYNQILNFDSNAGIIYVQAGVTLDALLKHIVPHGWFLPVTPGTKFITVGGAVAGDVHGKNHHSEGSFCDHVIELQVLLPDGRIVLCSRENNYELFNLVSGGLGLGAFILTALFRLKRVDTAYINQQNIIIKDLGDMLEQLQSFNNATYSVAWIDCLAKGKHLGRGVLMLGEHVQKDKLPGKFKEPLRIHRGQRLNTPFYFPSFVLNSFTMRLFNQVFFYKHRLARKDFVVHYDPYFYPLDFIRNWNKMYSRKGFLQYQFVLPFDQAEKGLEVILSKISRSGLASFLAVLKVLGKGNHTLSFPMPGFTLALDFPVSSGIFKLLDELDKLVIEYGGRIYLVKDARMHADVYWGGYPNAQHFKSKINALDPEHVFASLLSKRLKMI
ncbi:MAG: FAD-binding oxidoreductase [Cyclobacteriaceae bacterium]|nr:FAD-binding oxidoreductase [Cyclobacteriaceae bacterium]